MDYMIRATAANAQVRAFAVTTRDLVAHARDAHDLSPVATAALGRTMSAALMMADMLKGPTDLLTIKIDGDGPIGGILVTAYDGRSNEAKRNLDAFRSKAAEMGTAVIEPPIRATSKVYEAQGRRVNLSDYAPKSTAAQDYKIIVDKLLEQ